jgi:hypothetical protein
MLSALFGQKYAYFTSPLLPSKFQKCADDCPEQPQMSVDWFPGWKWGLVNAHSACSTGCPARRAWLSLQQGECRVEGCNSFSAFQTVVQESWNHLQQCFRRLSPTSDRTYQIDELLHRTTSYRLYEISKMAIAMLMLDILEPPPSAIKHTHSDLVESQLQALANLVDAVSQHASTGKISPRDAYITLQDTYIEQGFSTALRGLTVRVAARKSPINFTGLFQVQKQKMYKVLRHVAPLQSTQGRACLDCFLEQLGSSNGMISGGL